MDVPKHRWFRAVRGVAAVAATCLVVSVLGACSSGASNGSNSAKSSNSGNSGSNGSKSTYVIGQIGTFSGTYGTSGIGGRYGLDAWAKYTNAHGGINGHKVKVISMDDKLDAATALTAAKTLVEQDHVLAIVGVQSVVEDNITSYIDSGTVPVIGDDLAKEIMGKYKNFYPEGTTNDNLYYWGIPHLASTMGKKSYGSIYCAESTACQQIAQANQAEAKSAGVTFTFSRSAAADATNYTSQCLVGKSAGANSVGLFLAEPVVLRVAADCQQQGFKPLWLQGSNGFTQSETSASDLTVAGVVPDFAWFSSQTKAEKTFQSAMKKYEPEVFNASAGSLASYGYSEASALAWSSGVIFGAAASKMSGTPSGAAVEKGLAQLPKDDTFGGLTPPITYSSPGTLQPGVKCMFTIQLKNHTYSTLNQGKTTCKP